MTFKSRVLNFLISLDQFIYSIVTLGNSAPDETISAGLYRMNVQGKLAGKWLMPFVDWLFTWVERDHCRMSYYSEVNRNQARYL